MPVRPTETHKRVGEKKWRKGRVKYVHEEVSADPKTSNLVFFTAFRMLLSLRGWREAAFPLSHEV